MQELQQGHLEQIFEGPSEEFLCHILYVEYILIPRQQYKCKRACISFNLVLMNVWMAYLLVYLLTHALLTIAHDRLARLLANASELDMCFGGVALEGGLKGGVGGVLSISGPLWPTLSLNKGRMRTEKNAQVRAESFTGLQHVLDGKASQYDNHCIFKLQKSLPGEAESNQ